MTLWIRTEAAKAEVIFFRDKVYRSNGTIVGADFTEAAERLELLLKLFRYCGVKMKSYVFISLILQYPRLKTFCCTLDSTLD